MAEKVQCQAHGEREATFVCRHIVDSLDTRRAVGFYWSRDQLASRPDAWCSECERIRVAEGGEWSDKAIEFAQVKLLCGGCYDRAKSIWLEARRADTEREC